MKAVSSPSHPVPVETYTRQTVRFWYVDGLWDLAMAGFFAVTAVWIYPLMRTMDFPSWTWPWPFITQEPINPMQTEITLWAAGTLAIWVIYALVAYGIVSALKRRFVSPRLGDVRFQFFLPVERKVILLYLAVYVAGCVFLTWFYLRVIGGLHLYSVFVAVAPAGILFLMGVAYRIPRYRWVAAVGLILSVLLELLTTKAVFAAGPRNFFDVSPIYGNPSLTFLVWTGVLVVSGLIAFRQTLRLPYAQA
jgi:hypothetical protein